MKAFVFFSPFCFPMFLSGTTWSASVSLSFACFCKLISVACISIFERIAILFRIYNVSFRLWIKWPPKPRGLAKRGELGISVTSPLLSPNFENSLQTPDQTPHRSVSHSERKTSSSRFLSNSPHPLLAPSSQQAHSYFASQFTRAAKGTGIPHTCTSGATISDSLSE